MSRKGIVLLVGDYGNPFETGVAKLTVEGLNGTDVATDLAAMDTFADSLKTGFFTACEVSDVSITETTEQFKAKPGTSTNVDRQLVCDFRLITNKRVRKLTISGVADDASVLEKAQKGERLTEAGKTTLAGYMNTLFGYDGLTEGVIILRGKVLQKE